MKATLIARQAVRPWIEKSTGTILLGVSGGADSISLAIATLLEAGDREVIPVVIEGNAAGMTIRLMSFNPLYP